MTNKVEQNMKSSLRLRFILIDRWNRPTFKDQDSPHYFCYIDSLYRHNEKEKVLADIKSGRLEYLDLYLKGTDPEGEPEFVLTRTGYMFLDRLDSK